jgi:prepilin-type N-terminal cleavage/methylation domain-containing protein
MAPIRKGVSLIELLIVLAVGGLVGEVIAATVAGQQRFYKGAAQLQDAREATRDALEVLSTDIRWMSVADTLRLRADSAIELFAAIGNSVVCQVTGNEIVLPPARPSENSLTSFLMEPDTGDLSLFYSRSERDDERWNRHRIAAFSSRSTGFGCPPTSALGQGGSDTPAIGGYVLTLADAPENEIVVGSPVQFVRRVRYSLYHASDGHWYLGYRRCNALGISACGVIQPISGPYRAYSPDSVESGLVFSYFDAKGERLDATASPLSLTRVDISARSERTGALKQARQPGGAQDSATVTVAIRNGHQ